MEHEKQEQLQRLQKQKGRVEMKEPTEEAIRAMSLCRRRVGERADRLAVEVRERRRAELAKRSRSAESSIRGPAAALQRVEERKKKQLEKLNSEVEELALQQLSSMDALNVVRFLSPRFNRPPPKFVPSIVPHSVDDDRLRQLL